MLTRSVIVAVLSVFAPAVAAAQVRSHGYLVAGPFVIDEESSGATTFGVAVGGERLVGGGVSIGGEGGLIKEVGLALSANATKHFSIPALSRVLPFATGGYTMFVNPHGIAHAANVGVGLTFSGAHGLGARLELREHFLNRTGEHFLAIRIGLTF